MKHRPVRAAFALLVVFPCAAAGQTVDLVLREDPSRAPAAGAIVRLLQDGGTVAQGLANELGRIVLRAPGAGTYRIKIDRIGFGGFISDTIALHTGESYRREFLLGSARVDLPTLVVHGKSPCRLGDQEGTLAAALWEEIRKALTTNVLTQKQWAVPLHVRTFERSLGLSGRVEREWMTGSTLMRGQPFGSLSPAELAEHGFVSESNAMTTFAAPDAALILSSEFAAGHCFRAVTGGEALVGLAFEPIPAQFLPDVRGTLWVDRATSELRSLEYSYTRLRPELERASLGGRIEFQRIGSGGWIVSYWHIRMPRMAMTSVSTRAVGLIGYVEQGGRAEIATNTVSSPSRAVVVGRVYDSTVGLGLPGAVLRVRGLSDSVMTDAEGRFQLAASVWGEQVITAAHPKLGLAGGLQSRSTLLGLGDTVVANFSVPALATFVEVLCGAQQGRAGVIGIAWHAAGSPGEGLTVLVKWEDQTGRPQEERSLSGPMGIFAFCDLPVEQPLPVRLLYGSRTLLERTLHLRASEFRWMDLRP